MNGDDLSALAHRPGLIWGYDLLDGEAHPVRDDELGGPAAPGAGLRWLHLNLSDQRTMRWLASSVPPQMMAVLLAPEDEQTFMLEQDTLGLVVRDVERIFHEGDPRLATLHVLAGPTLVITARRHPVRSADLLKQRIEEGARLSGPLDAVELILACVLEAYRETTGELEAKVQVIEDELLEDMPAPNARQFTTLRAVMVRLRRAFLGLRNLLRRLEERPETAQSYGPIAAQAAVRLATLDTDLLAVQAQLRLLRDELDLQEAQTTNRNLYVLSILTALLLPATLVTGIFGMNTGGLAWTADRNGSLWAMGLVVGSAALAYLILRISGFIRR
jgi:Mg2+ and Co2+ transporter CorA